CNPTKSAVLLLPATVETTPPTSTLRIRLLWVSVIYRSPVLALTASPGDTLFKTEVNGGLRESKALVARSSSPEYPFNPLPATIFSCPPEIARTTLNSRSAMYVVLATGPKLGTTVTAPGAWPTEVG